MKTIRLFCPTDGNWKIDLMNRELKDYGITVVKYSLVDKVVNNDYRESARLKAIRSFSESGKPTLAMDVGLEISAFDGWPHTNISYEITHLGINAISDMVSHQTDRRFNYGLALAFIDSHFGSPKSFAHGYSGEISVMPVKPDISKEVRKLETIMIPDGYAKPLGEMDPDARKEFREQYETAFREFGEWFKEKIVK